MAAYFVRFFEYHYHFAENGRKSCTLLSWGFVSLEQTTLKKRKMSTAPPGSLIQYIHCLIVCSAWSHGNDERLAWRGWFSRHTPASHPPIHRIRSVVVRSALSPLSPLSPLSQHGLSANGGVSLDKDLFPVARYGSLNRSNTVPGMVCATTGVCLLS